MPRVINAERPFRRAPERVLGYTARMEFRRLTRRSATVAAAIAFIVFLLSFLSPEPVLGAYPGIIEFPEPMTVQGDDRVFVTTGTILLSGDRGRAEELIADVSRWRDWMLVGMDGPREDGKKLLVYLLDLAWTPAGETGPAVANASAPARPSGTLDVAAILPFMKSFGADPSSYRFDVRILRGDDGSLRAVVAGFVGDSFALRDAEYAIAIEDTPAADGSFAVRYQARVRIRGFLDFFFSLRAYRRTIGWYLDRIARNFAVAWNASP